jgi:hypothetical protein
LNLPVLRTRFDEEIHQLAQLWDNKRSDLGIDGGTEAVPLDRMKRFESGVK